MASPRFLVSPTTDEDRTFSLALPSAADLGISEEEEKSTAAAFVGCVGAAAQHDRRGRRISDDQARTLSLRPQTGTYVPYGTVRVALVRLARLSCLADTPMLEHTKHAPMHGYVPRVH